LSWMICAIMTFSSAGVAPAMAEDTQNTAKQIAIPVIL
jgi:hypothetical protein